MTAQIAGCKSDVGSEQKTYELGLETARCMAKVSFVKRDVIAARSCGCAVAQTGLAQGKRESLECIDCHGNRSSREKMIARSLQEIGTSSAPATHIPNILLLRSNHTRTTIPHVFSFFPISLSFSFPIPGSRLSWCSFLPISLSASP